MCDRFDTETTLTLARARDEAVLLNHDHVGSEHVLLALLADTQIAELLFRMGMTETDIRCAILDRVARGTRPILDDEIPLTAEAEDILESTLEESDGFGHPMARNGHLLLGLVKEPEGVGGRVLERFGGTLDGMRHEVLEFLCEHDG